MEWRYIRSRSAGSHGPVDIFAAKDTLSDGKKFLLIQVKKFPKAGVFNGELVTLCKAAEIYGGVAVLITKERDGEMAWWTVELDQWKSYRIDKSALKVESMNMEWLQS